MALEINVSFSFSVIILNSMTDSTHDLNFTEVYAYIQINSTFLSTSYMWRTDQNSGMERIWGDNKINTYVQLSMTL